MKIWGFIRATTQAFALAKGTAGSSTSLILFIISSLFTRGVRETLDLYTQTLQRVRNPHNSGISQPKFFQSQSFHNLWREQAEISSALKRNNPRPRIGNFIYRVDVSRAGDWLKSNLQEIVRFDPQLLFLDRHPVFGGSSRFSQVLIDAAASADTDARVLVLRIEGEASLDFVNPNRLKVLEISLTIEGAQLSQAQIATVLRTLLAGLQFQKCLVFNSPIAWSFVETENFENYCHTHFYGVLFCEDFDVFGRDVSLGSIYRGTLQHKLKGIVSDNLAYGSKLLGLCNQTGFGGVSSREVTRFDIPSKFSGSLKESNRKICKVLWVSRLTNQKGPDLLLRIAKKMPELEFLFFGEGNRGAVNRWTKNLPRNVKYFGKLETVEQLTELSPDIFLYTARWDGLPNIVVEMLSLGLPVLSSDLPGVRELQGRYKSIPIAFPESNRASSFVERLKEISRCSTGYFPDPESSLKAFLDDFNSIKLAKDWEKFVSKPSSLQT